ncbi:MAG: putative Histidine kinase [Promethearchaeota archaeon]|nr:MAG: putative Histidine kinase [Candidatus Lokiarchaeota archaeon]
MEQKFNAFKKDRSDEYHLLNDDTLVSLSDELENLKLEDIIDSNQLQSIMDDFFKLTNIGIAIIDMEGEILVATGWQDICTEFHRINPETKKKCIESDVYLAQDVQPGEYLIYKCKNNLWDMATPICVGGDRIGTLFLGQFFFEDDEINYEFFEKQAERYGFDKNKYLNALDRVPRWSRERVETVMSFYTQFASMISELSYKNLLLRKYIQKQKKIENDLRASEDALKEALQHTRFYRDLLSHDIGNKLNNINLSIQLLEDIEDFEQHGNIVQEYANIIKQEVNEGQSIISRVQKLSKAFIGEIEKEPINLKEYIVSAIESAKNSFQTKKSKIHTSYPKEEIIVQGGSLLLDAFENILINGALHNNNNVIKLWVEISASEQKEGYVKIEFKDNGVGIPEKLKSDLFNKSIKKLSERGGMGIGLSLVKNIITSYDGEIWVENRIKNDYRKGSNFVILLEKI